MPCNVVITVMRSGCHVCDAQWTVVLANAFDPPPVLGLPRLTHPHRAWSAVYDLPENVMHRREFQDKWWVGPS